MAKIRVTIEYEERIGADETVSLHAETDPPGLDISALQVLGLLELASRKVEVE